jgi:hypothetical protein
MEPLGKRENGFDPVRAKSVVVMAELVLFMRPLAVPGLREVDVVSPDRVLSLVLQLVVAVVAVAAAEAAPRVPARDEPEREAVGRGRPLAEELLGRAHTPFPKDVDGYGV